MDLYTYLTGSQQLVHVGVLITRSLHVWLPLRNLGQVACVVLKLWKLL